VSAAVGARFDLVDHDGNQVSNATYRGRYPLVFFGFTHCKVVCPRALARLSAVLDELGDKAEAIQPLYVTVDPERDTSQRMKDFLTENYPLFTGLTGTSEQIAAAQKQFRVFAAREADPDGVQEYVVPHSAITYLLDRSGEFRTHFTDSLPADEVVTRLAAVLAEDG